MGAEVFSIEHLRFERTDGRLAHRVRVAQVRYVANALPRNNGEDQVTKFADLSSHGVLAMPIAPQHPNWRLVRRAGQYRMFSSRSQAPADTPLP